MPLYCSWRCGHCNDTSETQLYPGEFDLVREVSVDNFCRDNMARSWEREYFDTAKRDCERVSHPNGWAVCLIPIPKCVAWAEGEREGHYFICGEPLQLTRTSFDAWEPFCCLDASSPKRDVSRSPRRLLATWPACKQLVHEFRGCRCWRSHVLPTYQWPMVCLAVVSSLFAFASDVVCGMCACMRTRAVFPDFKNNGMLNRSFSLRPVLL